MLRTALLAIAFGCFPISAFAQDIEPEAVQPGILATYSDSQTKLSRLESAIAINVPGKESPHPAIASSGYRIQWVGTINVLRNGSYRFEANLIGKFSLSIGDKNIFEAIVSDGKSPIGANLELKSGIYPLVAQFEAKDAPAQLELLWQTPGSRMEPIPHAVLGHQSAKLPDGKKMGASEYGRFLFEELSCFKCHMSGTNDLKSAGIPDRTGPNLTDIASRTNGAWLNHWLDDPSKVRPATAMPKMFADDATGKAEQKAVVSYLLTLGKPTVDNARPARPQDYIKSINSGKALFTSVGCAACHPNAIPKDKIESSVNGFGGQVSVVGAYPLGNVGSKFTEKSLTKYLQNPQATQPHGRMPSMNLSGTEAQDIAHFLMQSTEKDPLPAFVADKQESELGKQLITSKGCINCHAVEPAGKSLPTNATFVSLEKIREKPTEGCLSAKGKGARYHLNDNQRSALQAFLQSKQVWPGNKATGYQTQIAFKRFGCVNCHIRDGEGGISNALADAMKRYEKSENVDDVRPPVLTGVGHKLRTSWFQKVLLEAGRSRPWMSLRMPQYGADNVGNLVEGLSRIEGEAPNDALHEVKASRELLEAGRLMLGKNGLGCIGCHDIAGIQNSGTRGPDLATTNQRVRYDWYRRWMEQPQRMDPKTRMPQVFIDGKSPMPNLMGGDTDRQADAMWAYMALGPTMPLPAGLEPPKGLNIAVTTRPEILRTFMPELGSRGIAVGYPGSMNLAFDAATCRLAYAWAGNFLDASPVWANRGGAPAKLLGSKIWTSPDFNPWASSSSTVPPDFKSRSGDPAYGAKLPDLKRYDGEARVNFEGYALDADGNPTFKYRIKGDSTEPLHVAEKPLPISSSLMNGLQRSYTVQAPEGQQTWLYVGSSKTLPKMIAADNKITDAILDKPLPIETLIALSEADRFTINQATGLTCAATWLIRKNGDGYEVLLKLSADSKKKETVNLRSWIATKLDAATVGVVREGK